MIGLVHKTLHLMQSYCFIGIKFESTIFQTAICLFLSVYVYMPTLWACRIQPYTRFEILDFYILPLELVRGWPWHILDPAFNLSARPPPDNADHTHAHTRPLANFLCRTIVDIPPVGSVSRWFIDRLNKLYCRHEMLQRPRVRNIVLATPFLTSGNTSGLPLPSTALPFSTTRASVGRSSSRTSGRCTQPSSSLSS